MKVSEEIIRGGERGQIRHDSPFGQALTAAARAADRIVEIGTWRGLGSTYCLYCGMRRPEQRLWTVELCRKQWLEAQSYYDDGRIAFLNGTLVLPGETPPFEHPDPAFRQYYDIEVAINATALCVLDQLPDAIDLLLIDGGSWSGGVEFAKLEPRARVIALDDTNPARDIKNCRNREKLLAAHWRVLHDRQEDRNGWAIFERP